MKNIFWALLLFSFCADAQRKKSSFPEHLFPENKTAISFNPFALAEIDYTALVGVENRIAPRLYASNEAGYIFASNYVSANGDDRSSSKGTGFLIRPSIKWFVADNGKFYLQPQVFYKQVTHKMHDWLGKSAVNGVSSYEELQDFKYRRKIYGFNTVAGFVLAMDQHRNGYIDFYFGVGLRYKKTVIVGEPHSVYQNESEISYNGVLPSVPMGIRFIYAIK